MSSPLEMIDVVVFGFLILIARVYFDVSHFVNTIILRII